MILRSFLKKIQVRENSSQVPKQVKMEQRSKNSMKTAKIHTGAIGPCAPTHEPSAPTHETTLNSSP